MRTVAFANRCRDEIFKGGLELEAPDFDLDADDEAYAKSIIKKLREEE